MARENEQMESIPIIQNTISNDQTDRARFGRKIVLTNYF